MKELPTEISDILRAGAAMTGSDLPVSPNDGRIPYVVIPDGYKIEDLEHLLKVPTRSRGDIMLLDTASFIDFVKGYGTAGSCRLYVDADYEASRCRIVAILNDHGQSGPDWRDHTATFAPKLSVEWKRWTETNSRQMAQSVFATFLEENLPDIRPIKDKDLPSGTDMLEMALNFEATSEKRFKKRIDLGTGGVQLEYVDKADETTSKKFKFLSRFSIAIPVFQGSNVAYQIEARLKFRQNGESLNFWYELIRSDRVFMQAVTEAIDVIKKETGFPLFYGDPGLNLVQINPEYRSAISPARRQN